MVDRFQDDVIDQHPEVVVILAGTNDTYPGWALCGVGPASGYNDHNHDTCHNIDYMVTQAQANDTVPILATIPPWGCTESNCALAVGADGSADRYARISQLNEWIKAYGFSKGLIVLDYHTALTQDGNSYVPALTIDGVHPTPAGYALMEPMVEDAIAVDARK
jgi:lysophospholipase L1-like esterase